MKTEEKVASKFIEARDIMADYGDVEEYFNTADFFETQDGSRLSPYQVKLAERYLELALSLTWVSTKMDNLVRKALNRINTTEAHLAGLKVK